MAEGAYGAIDDLLAAAVETGVPLFVRRRTDANELATWIAVRYLIEVLGVESFGSRDVAAEMGNRSYPRVSKWLASLVDKGLLTLVGFEEVPGGLHERGTYKIPHEAIMLGSISDAKKNLEQRRYRRGATRPPVAQLQLTLAEPPEPPPVIDGSQYCDPSVTAPLPMDHSRPDDCDPSVTAPLPMDHSRGVPLLPMDHSTVIHRSQSPPQKGASYTESAGDCDPSVTATVIDRSHSMHAGKQASMHDTARERARPSWHNRAGPNIPRRLPAAPSADLFADHPLWVYRGRLHAHPLDLWEDAAERPTNLDIHHLASLADEHDGPTEGHGWYWLGQAILALTASGRGIGSPRAVKSVLEDWLARNAYGSDRPNYQAIPGGKGARNGSKRGGERGAAPSRATPPVERPDAERAVGGADTGADGDLSDEELAAAGNRAAALVAARASTLS